jgi:hypothetical protein
MLKARQAGLAVLLAFVGLLWATPGMAQGQGKDDPASLWADFNHYVRIARPDLAQAVGSKLLGSVDDQKLLDIVEASDYRDYDRTLTRAENTATLSEIAGKFRNRIQAARIQRSREPQRIMADIRRLAEGSRAQLNATERLKAAGQFAAPALLATLLNEGEAKLHPFVLAAMVAVGRPLVYPLAEALPDLEPVPQGQIAQVLAEIGYPRAIPYVKLVLDRPTLDANTRSICQAAFDTLAQNARVPRDVSADELFLTLGQNHYRAATTGELLPGLDPADKSGVVWQYNRQTGLVSIAVPTAIFGDVLAMRAASRALGINASMSPALSLWLAANLRRENRLPAGAADLSYPKTMMPPKFYIESAGPLRQHDVLNRALDDADAALALDAIAALAATAGTDALVNREGTVQPLLRALSYPDRRVRFAAAFAMTNARPSAAFPGSHRVVPVLAEALRQSENRYALVIGRNRESANSLGATVRELGFQAIAGTALSEVRGDVNAGPGVDLIVTDLPIDAIADLYHTTGEDYKLAAVPLLAVISAGDQIEFNRRYEGHDRLRSTLASTDPKALSDAVKQAASAYAGDPIGADEALVYATSALALLRSVAVGSAAVFQIADAEPALVQALGDARESIVTQAADVLALIPSPDAQRQIADAALDMARPENVRIALLGSLAESAKNFGSHLIPAQSDRLLTLVKESSGDLAIASARAHGALTMPTGNVVELLLKNR